MKLFSIFQLRLRYFVIEIILSLFVHIILNIILVKLNKQKQIFLEIMCTQNSVATVVNINDVIIIMLQILNRHNLSPFLHSNYHYKHNIF